MTATMRRGIRTSRPQRVAFVELFFDLVFVFAVTQVTAATAHELTPLGIFHSVLLGWLIWWAWTQFTWTLNPADTSHDVVRVVTLAATGGAFVMAATVPRAFGDQAIWFALPYLFVRCLGLGLQVLVELERDGVSHAGVFRWAGASTVGLVLVLIGAVVDPALRSVVWLAAIVADLGAAAIAGSRTSWDLNPAHITERHGLFVIIALGESMIVAGVALSGSEPTVALVSTVTAVLVVAGLLWWTYFGWLMDALEHRFAAVDPSRLGPLARDAFSLAHFPLICGIVGFAVAVEETVAHPDAPMTAAVLASLGVGVGLVVAASALALWRLGGPVLVARLATLAVIAAGLLVTAAVAPPPLVPLGIVAVGLFAIVVNEARTPPDRASVEPGDRGS